MPVSSQVRFRLSFELLNKIIQGNFIPGIRISFINGNYISSREDPVKIILLKPVINYRTVGPYKMIDPICHILRVFCIGYPKPVNSHSKESNIVGPFWVSVNVIDKAI